MNVKELIRETLDWLLERYKENPNAIWDIKHILNEKGIMSITDVHEIGKYLTNNRLIANQQFRHDGFCCTISMSGINSVSNILSKAKVEILEATIERGESSMMQILHIEPYHFQRAHSFAKYFESLGIINCVFGHNDISISPTIAGKEWYQDNKPIFFN